MALVFAMEHCKYRTNGFCVRDAVYRFLLTAEHLRGPDALVSRLNYLDGKYYFRFEMCGEGGYCEFSPGQEMVVQRELVAFWMGQQNSVKFWSGYLKREINAPDLWAEMEKYKTSVSIALPEQLLNEPIPANEAEKISEQQSMKSWQVRSLSLEES